MKKYRVRPGLTKFSIIYPYWTNITYDKDDWGHDLVDHLSEEGDIEMSGDGDSGEIGFGVEVNSQEEMKILEEYFRRYPEFSKIHKEIYSENLKDRIWFTHESGSPWSDDIYGVLKISPLKFKDYNLLRESLLELWKLGFLVEYRNDLMLY